MTNSPNKSKLKFLGFLQNVDDSIMGLKLKHGLSIKSISDLEAFDLLQNLGNWDEVRVRNVVHLDSHIGNLDTHRVYFIDAELESDLEDGGRANNVAKFQHDVINPYLVPILTALRLYKAGDIGYWNQYFFDSDNPKGGRFILSNMYNVTGNSVFSLLPTDIEECNRFIDTFKHPQETYLDISIENFENSYMLHTNEASFLSLMISLEALFSKSHNELSFRLCRNCAIFLSTDYKEGEEIYNKIFDLNNKRGSLVHGKLKRGKILDDDVDVLGDYVRRSIKKFLVIKEKHSDLLKRLDSLGFGQFELLEE